MNDTLVICLTVVVWSVLSLIGAILFWRAKQIYTEKIINQELVRGSSGHIESKLVTITRSYNNGKIKVVFKEVKY